MSTSIGKQSQILDILGNSEILKKEDMWSPWSQKVENILGYVCNPGSSREQDAASEDARGTPSA